MNNENFIIIQGWMINELKLSGNELLLYAIIYGYSQDGISRFKGSLTYIMSALNITKKTVIDVGKKLIEKGYIKKDIDEKENIAYYFASIENIPQGCRKYTGGSIESILDGSIESIPNKDNKIIINNNILSEDKKSNKKEASENIYKTYFNILPDNKKQYVKKAQAVKYIEALLKEYSEADLLSSIKNYKNNTDTLYLKAPQYFFSNTIKGKDYRLFEQWTDTNFKQMLKRENNVCDIKLF